MMIPTVHWIILVLCWVSHVSAQGLGNLLSPGELARPHQSLRGLSKCVVCHQGDRNQACLDCHKEIQRNLDIQKGYHAKYPDTLCQKCHSDHKGKDYDLLGLSRLSFDHNKTDWPLEGKHAEVKCLDCHTQKRTDVMSGRKLNRPTYLQAKTECIDCHKDPHKGDKGKSCQSCHTAMDWNKIISEKIKQVVPRQPLPQARPVMPRKKIIEKTTPTPTPAPFDPQGGNIMPSLRLRTTTAQDVTPTPGPKK